MSSGVPQSTGFAAIAEDVSVDDDDDAEEEEGNEPWRLFAFLPEMVVESVWFAVRRGSLFPARRPIQCERKKL